MEIRKINVKNLRGIKEVKLETDKRVNVIVGPNAVGKTTILEAIRLVKALVAPRFFQEGSQTLQAMGILSQHFQFLGRQGLDYASLAHDASKNIEISIDIVLNDEEIEVLRGSEQQLALAMLQSRLARPEDQLQLVQYLSTSEGAQALGAAQAEASKAVGELKPGVINVLSLTIDAATGTPRGDNIVLQQAIAHLERTLPPHLTKLSMFPADRAMPHGEVPIQIGSADAQQQVLSHLAQPGLKYQRLKIAITAAIISGRLGQEDLEADFRAIFSGLLPGKTFEHIQINELGLLKVMVKDVATGKVFDIDGMSSGEKGIILTFLFIRQSVASGGIVLLDEPELHLNPAVTRNIVKFLMEKCCDGKNIQAFICTHSPEILSDAYESDGAALFHLRGPTDLTPVYRQDNTEVLEILQRLGVTTADVLFNKGNIFVEGEHDAEILSEGYDDIIGAYKINRLGGREEVEKAVRALSDVDKTQGQKPKIFILDNDRKPTSLQGSGFVVVKQWSRYCLENYLLDDKVLFEVVREYATDLPESRGVFSAFLKEKALAQVEGVAIRRAYAPLEPANAGIRSSEIKDKTVEEAASVLARRVADLKGQLADFEVTSWEAGFVAAAGKVRAELLADWENTWRTEADGKRLLDALYARYRIRLDKLTFKKKVMRAMRAERTDTWRAIASLLTDAVTGAT